MNIAPGKSILLVDTEANEDKLRVILFRRDYNAELYGIVIADAIRHVALALVVPEDQIIAAVAKELNKPTSALMQVGGWGMTADGEPQ